MSLISVHRLEELPSAAKALLAHSPGKKIFAFYGEMGAGKTTFIKSICAQLGVKNVTSSPTFSLVNEYVSGTGEKIYHFDFYRLKNESEAYDLGYEDYFFSGAFCFIEWPEKIISLLPSGTQKVRIEVKDGIREISLI